VDDREGLMVTAAMFLLVGMKGSEEEVQKANSCLKNFPDIEVLTAEYGSASVALVKMIKDITS